MQVRLSRMKKLLLLAEKQLQHAQEELSTRDKRIQELEATAGAIK